MKDVGRPIELDEERCCEVSVTGRDRDGEEKVGKQYESGEREKKEKDDVR